MTYEGTPTVVTDFRIFQLHPRYGILLNIYAATAQQQFEDQLRRIYRLVQQLDESRGTEKDFQPIPNLILVNS